MKSLLARISALFNWLAVIALLLMFAIVSADILSSKIFGRPITGAVDYVSLLAVIVASFSVSQTILAGRHIEVEFIVIRLPIPMRKAFNLLSSLLSAGFFALVALKSLSYARHVQLMREATLTERIPIAPFVYAMAVACIPAIFIYALRAYKDTKEVI
ncbi:MAG: TRAP transporter small permease [candidate division WOR-3 bacterium]